MNTIEIMEVTMIDYNKDKYVLRCPYCGGEEMIEAFQSCYGAVIATSNVLGGRTLYHMICRNCGSVVRSFVKEPEKLLKRRDRRKVLYR